MMREKNICSRFRTRACHGIIIIMVWHNNTVLIIYNKGVRTVACPACARCVPRGCVAGDAVFARRLPLRMRAAPRGREGKGGGRRGKMSKSAGRAGENRKKTEKVEKKSLKSLEIRQRALPLQSRSGRGPRCLLRGSGEVH